MKDLAKMVISSLIGTMLGYGLASHAPVAAAADVQRIETKELVVLGDNGKPAERIVARNSGAVLEFYDNGGNKAVELGFEEAQSWRHLTFLNHDGGVLAGLNSSRQKGDSTLFLGNDDFQGRIVIGAIPSDTDEPLDWGLEIQNIGSIQPAFSLLTMRGKAPHTWTTGIHRNQNY